MKVLIPIDNFNIEKTFKLGDVYFIPASEYKASTLSQKKIELPKINFTDNIEAYEFTGESLRDLGSILTGIHIEDVWNMTVAVTEINWTDSSYYANQKNDDELMLLESCEKVDRVLDIVRVNFSRMDNPLMNPGIPGLLNTGYSGMVIFSPEIENEYRIIGHRLYGLTMVNGIGLDLDSQQIDSLINDEFAYFLDSSIDNYVFNLSKLALKRLSEAMYIPMIDSKFIYLMTTIESIASPEYVQFKKAKSRIIPFLVSTKKQYHLLSNRLKVLSEEIRTEVVHNGKSITEIRKHEYKKILWELQSIIARLILAFKHSNCKTEEEMDEYRENKIKNLGIN